MGMINVFIYKYPIIHTHTILDNNFTNDCVEKLIRLVAEKSKRADKKSLVSKVSPIVISPTNFYITRSCTQSENANIDGYVVINSDV